MSAIVVAGDTSGSVTLNAPAVSGTTVITLPTTSGTMALSGGAVSGTTGTFSGAVSCTDLTTTGNTILGNASTDTTSINGGVTITSTDPQIILQPAADGNRASIGYKAFNGTTYWTVGLRPATSAYHIGVGTDLAGTGVYLAYNGTSWTANSDERMKDIIEPITDGLNKVASLRSIIGKYKTDAEGVRRSFLIAQDVQAVLPEAVESSNPDNLGVNYAEVIPLLVAAIKELKTISDTQQALIENLTTRLAALENK